MEAVKNNSYGIRATIKKWFYHNIVWWYNRNLDPFLFYQDDYRGGVQTLYVTPPSSVEDLTQDSSNAPTREVIKKLLDKVHQPKSFNDVTTEAERDALTGVGVADLVTVRRSQTDWTRYVARGASPTPNWGVDNDSDTFVFWSGMAKNENRALV